MTVSSLAAGVTFLRLTIVVTVSKLATELIVLQLTLKLSMEPYQGQKLVVVFQVFYVAMCNSYLKNRLHSYLEVCFTHDSPFEFEKI